MNDILVVFVYDIEDETLIKCVDNEQAFIQFHSPDDISIGDFLVACWAEWCGWSEFKTKATIEEWIAGRANMLGLYDDPDADLTAE